MGNACQLEFVKRHRQRVDGPVLEIGSKDYGNTSDFRPMFAEQGYLGVDQFPGEGVDRVCDLTADFDTVAQQLGQDAFSAVICLSVLEHCGDPFAMARNISRLVKPGGTLFLSVPWVWSIHGYPDDYWRFTPSAVKLLFPDFHMDTEASHWASKQPDWSRPIDQTKLIVRPEQLLKGKWWQRAKRLGLTNPDYPEQYYCYPLLINALLFKRPEAETPPGQSALTTHEPEPVRESTATSSRTSLDQTIATARGSLAYRNYEAAREFVLARLDAAASDASDYWAQEVAGFDYMLDASPLVIAKLREHCYHITGLFAYEYREHHTHRRNEFAAKLKALRAIDPLAKGARPGLLVPEPDVLGGFGHVVDGSRINIDTLKFYEVLIGMYRSNLIKQAVTDEGHGLVLMEIGSGWGGLGYQLKRLLPQATLVLVDLPQTFLFSATYLPSVLPDARVCMPTELPNAEVFDPGRYDFVFLDHKLLADVSIPSLQGAVNTCSFQEMSKDQVHAYGQWLAQADCPWLYSLNRDQSPHNAQMTRVSEILAEYGSVTPVPMLDKPYAKLGQATSVEKAPSPSAKEPGRYQHLVLEFDGSSASIGKQHA